jgi:hypothetical protein
MDEAYQTGGTLLELNVWAQGSIKRTDTFEQRFPPDQPPTPAVEEKPPNEAPPQTDEAWRRVNRSVHISSV